MCHKYGLRGIAIANNDSVVIWVGGVSISTGLGQYDAVMT
jgi:hypothetical protein